MTARAQIGREAFSLVLRGPLQAPLERLFVSLGHRFPYTLRGRGSLAAAIAQRHDQPLIARLGHGSLVSVPPETDGAALYLLGGLQIAREHATELLFERTLCEGDVMLDIGANLGFYTFLAAKRVGSSGCAYAFEPQLDLVKHLRRSIELNDVSDRVVVVHAAVVERDQGPVPLFFLPPGEESGGVSTLPLASLEARPRSTAPPVVLDDWLDQLGLEAVHVIKIDIEGAELYALRGARRLLEEIRPRLIVVELGLPGGSSPDEVAALLAEYDYEPRRITPDGSLGDLYGTADLETLDEVSNIAFVRSEGIE